MTEPRVSILMACYNGARFISRSFESILAQTWPNIELVFVDDGSTDDSKEVAKQYSERFAQKGFILKILSQKNQGAAAASNNAAKAASGKYIQLLDVDDYIMPESCRLQAEFLENHPECNVIRTNGYIINESTQETVGPLEKDICTAPKNIFKDLVSGATNNWAGAYMVRAEKHTNFYSANSFPITNYGQNLQFLLPQTIDSNAGFIDIPLFKYFRNIGSHSNQISYEKQMENLNGYWDIRRKMLKLLNVEDKDVWSLGEKSFLIRAITIAFEFKKNADYKRFYTQLKKMNGLTLELKIQDSIRNRSVKQYWYRTLFKLTRILANNR